MIDLAESNSRMKDFYDVYQLLSKRRFDAEVLQMAIKQTFENRKTALDQNHPLLITGDRPRGRARREAVIRQVFQ